MRVTNSKLESFDQSTIKHMGILLSYLLDWPNIFPPCNMSVKLYKHFFSIFFEFSKLMFCSIYNIKNQLKTICWVFANFSTLYTKYQLEFRKVVNLNLEKSKLFTEISKQIDENFTRGQMAVLWIRNFFCSNFIILSVRI